MTTIHSNNPMTVGDMVCIQDDNDMKYYRVVRCDNNKRKWITHLHSRGNEITGLYSSILERLK